MASLKTFRKEMEALMDACKDMSQDDMLLTYNGILFPKLICNPDTFKAMESFQLREDDLLLASYPKCVVFGSYFDYAVKWNKHIDNENALIMTFEEMKEDLYKAVKKISTFFGYSLTEEQVQLILDKCTFKSMKAKSDETHGYFGKVVFRKGDVGDWKNHFSEAQSKEMDAKFEEYLAGTKFGNLMKYSIYCKA